jgi:gamma-glutamyltranspeptidase/glutathione hydrolase
MFHLSVFLLTLLASIEALALEKINSESAGVASTAHPLATQAADDIYRMGGNSVDAAIAASFVLSVVEPTMSGLGGRALAIVRSEEGDFYGYNAMTEIPKGFVKSDNMPAFGYSTVATPGLVAMLGAMHQKHGRLAFAVLVKPAIRHAEDGFAVLPGAAVRQKSAIQRIKLDVGMTKSFLRGEGATLKAGQILKQPALAMTLRQIAQEGSDTFYSGEIARLISEDMASNGGYVTLQDLEDYRVLPGRYISIPYRDHVVHTLAAPGGGGLVAKALILLGLYDLSSLEDQRWALLLSQVLGLSIESMTDNYYEKDLVQLVDQGWAVQQAKRVFLPAPGQKTKTPEQTVHQSELTDWVGSVGAHTSHLVAQDCGGLTVSMTQTIGPIFGAKVATPKLGFAYAATMGGYLRTGPQNPGERPRTAIAPVIVTKDDKVVLALGAAGGIKIPSAIVQVISRYIDQKKTLSDSLSAPRVHPSATIDNNNKRVVRLMAFNAETSSPGWTVEDLSYWRAAGFEVDEVASAASFGRVHVIAADNGSLLGEADPDWEGTASAQQVCSMDSNH